MQDHQANVKNDDCACIISLSFDLIPESAHVKKKKKTFSNCPQCGRFPDLFLLILPKDK